MPMRPVQDEVATLAQQSGLTFRDVRQAYEVAATLRPLLAEFQQMVLDLKLPGKAALEVQLSQMSANLKLVEEKARTVIAQAKAAQVPAGEGTNIHTALRTLHHQLSQTEVTFRQLVE